MTEIRLTFVLTPEDVELLNKLKELVPGATQVVVTPYYDAGGQLAYTAIIQAGRDKIEVKSDVSIMCQRGVFNQNLSFPKEGEIDKTIKQIRTMFI